MKNTVKFHTHEAIKDIICAFRPRSAKYIMLGEYTINTEWYGYSVKVGGKVLKLNHNFKFIK